MKKLLIALIMICCMTAFIAGCSSGYVTKPGENNEQQKTEEEKVEKTKNEAVSSASLLYSQETAGMSAEEKFTVSIAYNALIEKINALKGTSSEIKAKADEYYLELKNVVSTVKSEVENVGQAIEKAKAEIKIIYDNVLNIVNNEIKPKLTAAYNEVLTEISSYKTKEDVEKTVTVFKAAVYSYADNLISLTLNEVKTLAIKELNNIISEVINGVPYNDVKATLTAYKAGIEEKINSAATEEEIKAVIAGIKDEALRKIKEVTEEKISALKTEITGKITSLINTALEKVEDEELKSDLRKYLESEISKINAVENLNAAKETFESMQSDAQAFIKEQLIKQLNKLKASAKATLDGVYNSAIEKTDNENIKKSLKTAYDNSMAEIEKISDAESAKKAIATVTENFKTACADILKEAINVVVEKCKTKLKNVYDSAVKSLSDSAKSELEKIYAEAINALSFVESAQDISVIGDKFINNIKALAIKEINNIISEVINGVPYNDVKATLTAYKAGIEEKINSAATEEEIKAVIAGIKDEALRKIKEVTEEKISALKTEITGKITSLINTALEKVEDEELKSDLRKYLESEISKINAVENLNAAKETFESMQSDAQAFIKEQLIKQLNKLKASAKATLDGVYNSAIEKTDNENIKKSLKTAYDNSMAEIEKISDAESAKKAIATVTENFKTACADILKEAINVVVEKCKTKLKNVYDSAVKSLSDSAKSELEKIYAEAINALSFVESAQDISVIVEKFKDDAKTYVVAALQAITEKLGSVPEPMAFLPNCFSIENTLVKAEDIPDYSKFTAVNKIPQNYIGKQLNVVYGVLNKTTIALSYVNKIYAVFGTIGTAYNTIFDNQEGENLTLNCGDFLLTVTLDKEKYELSAKIGKIDVILYANLKNDSYGGKIILTETTTLKYRVEKDKLTIAMTVLNTVATLISFEKNGENVKGYIYETIVAKDKTLTSTSALLSVKGGYTTVVGNKGDFIPTSNGINCEVYENVNGRFVGSEVYEEVSESKYYDTLWYNLCDIGGINSIKYKVDEEGNRVANLPNADTIYINDNSEKSIKSGTVTEYGGKFGDFSRPCDIEFKKVFAYIYNEELKEYESVVYEVPMMFIQERCLEKFCEFYKKKNSDLITENVSLKVSDEAKSEINYGYHTLVNEYREIKDAVTYQSILDYE